MTAQEWADHGIVELHEELRTFEIPLDLERAALFIRAAYGKGYQDGLTDTDTAIVLDVLEFRDELALRVPVF
jgi:hypothetical protein